MCRAPSTLVLFLTVGAGACLLERSVLFWASPAGAVGSLGWPDFGLAYLMATTASAFTVPAAFRVLSTLAPLTTLSSLLAFTSGPIQLQLPLHAIPDPRAPPVTVTMPLRLGLLPRRIVLRIGPRRSPGPFALFLVQWG